MTMRKWIKWFGIVLGAVLVLLLAAGTWLWTTKPWIPAIELAEPGPGGERINQPGLIGNFYPGEAEGKRAAVLVLGGSEGGLGGASEAEARLLAKQGFAALAIGYYRLPGQPEKLEDVPLETITRALDWLKAQPTVDPARIAIMGTSKGAEAALLVASRRSDVAAVVAAVPSHVVWQGFDWNFTPVESSSWSEGGKPVPFLPLTPGGFSSDVYTPALAALPQHREAVIPVERIAGPVLLLCGEADSLWPSCPMARAVKTRRDGSGADLQTTLLAYKDAGHFGVGPPLPEGKDVPFMLTVFGGTEQGNNAARKDGWPRTLAFLETALAEPAARKASR
ncbi:acyl-CoA thioester hydrolase/BAAT C-terminal domain-containing protein [Erythrobacter sp. T5W1-R]|uniref:acyl-CoA thioester hydrolase/BAAT C-terminal domain-containing protein n=1 Tax=Erythrobacter sp. T5W1-R TaxID=3101752 RepID=UPI002AFE7FEA|nr:acyl-CoA thioester hydrolase/BAAT C-terminal domain-containing protein [Erythrobacter sp. T5W1-R]MEA1618615.1 acyl-CoA thioester hydrolase/BAAT C-terminal domain-containing protein [Erythrobacter sp. T5W1-R]